MNNMIFSQENACVTTDQHANINIILQNNENKEIVAKAIYFH